MPGLLRFCVSSAPPGPGSSAGIDLGPAWTVPAGGRPHESSVSKQAKVAWHHHFFTWVRWMLEASDLINMLTPYLHQRYLVYVQ